MGNREDADRAAIPLTSLLFGYGPMAPFAAAAIGAWILPKPWPALATHLASIWGGVILVFVAGVRRGYGFGDDKASTAVEIAAMLAYFSLGALSLLLASLSWLGVALGLQAAGYCLVCVLDRRAAFTGDAPRYFARLRVRQMPIAVAALLALLAHLLV
jgi:hypothetical protein